jgi:Na+/H+ antiporter NhaD/arsenite permease-like protein
LGRLSEHKAFLFMTTLIILLFILGYLAIATEHAIGVDKAASALLTGVLCWTVYIAGTTGDYHEVLHHLDEHFSGIAGILFFLLSAMVIVELIDAHDGFDIITQQIRTTDKRKLLWITAFITFFLSAVLDNLTTTIVMVSLIRKLVGHQEDRLFFAGMIVIAANAGGAWSPIGDVTTTMLWIGGQVTAVNIMKTLFLPSLVCLIAPLLVLSFQVKGAVAPPVSAKNEVMTTTAFERNAVFSLGLGALLFVPVFKTVTHLPPVMGILLGLGILWLLTEFIHRHKNTEARTPLTVGAALKSIDASSILFFLGILLAIAALESSGLLSAAATWLNNTVGNTTLIVILIGLLSAIVDNVPLVAATQGMYSLTDYPTDHFMWEFLAYCTGTGGSVLIIGSAAGVAAMGLEKIDFFWYMKRISLLALIGYFLGAAVYVVEHW